MSRAVGQFARLVFSLLACCAQFVIPLAAPAQRKPVLPQIDLPHPYYFREMYLPQLTSGPSSVAWSPDSQSVVYSMGGSLWRQRVSETSATQLTDGDGYDYQPDWSPDGKWIVFTSYQNDALELWVLEVATGATTQVSSGGAVNVEPRWSPDGKKLVFVSTAYNRRFHIFVAGFHEGKLQNITRLTGETKSELPRYYYSAYDMEISPVWSRDGQEILFVSNRGHIYGTGGFWRMKALPGAEAREIHYEETNWKARPEFSPDGSRMVYSSYLGGQWHQLWTMPAGGGDAFPLTYGDYDLTNVRWSPDGKTLAYITNRSINTSMGLLEVISGRQRLLVAVTRNFKREHGTIRVKVFDDTGAAVAARISVVDEHGKFYAPDHARLAADDGYDRNERKFEAHYFDTDFDSSVRYRILEPSGRKVFVPAEHVLAIEVPVGMVTVSAMKGFEYRFETQQVQVSPGPTDVNLHLTRLNAEMPDRENWISGDLHVHMNYGGIYKNSPDDLVKQAQSEGLSMVNALIVNKEQRIPDLAYRNGGTDNGTQKDATILFGQEFHTSYWGHRGLLYPGAELLVPGYAGYPNTAASSLYPMNADVYDLVHSHGVLVGAVHPFDETPDPLGKPQQKITDELPIDVALGKLDYMEILGFSDHRSTAAVWYRLLNLGFRIPAGAGTDAMANFASLRGPVGMNRVYAHVDSWIKEPDFRRWLDALRNGKTFATNGPLLAFTLGGKQIGDELALPWPQGSVSFTAKLRSIVPVDHLEVVCNGKVAATLKLDRARTSSDLTGTIPVAESGWCILRAASDAAEYPVLDNYVYATTSAIYVSVGGKATHAPEDAKYFVAWIDRVAEATAGYPDWNSTDEKKYVLGRIAEAREIYLKME